MRPFPELGLKLRKAFKAVPLFPIFFYRVFLSPYFGGQCRFVPSCSEYAAESIQKHGVLRGINLSLVRISRCHPFSERKFDPVPPSPQSSVN